MAINRLFIANRGEIACRVIRTAKRMGEAFIKRYGLGDDFQFNNIRKGTGATVATVRQEIKANKFTVDVHLVSAPGFFAAACRIAARSIGKLPLDGMRLS